MSRCGVWLSVSEFRRRLCNAQTVVLDVCVCAWVGACVRASSQQNPIPHLSPAISLAALLSPSPRSRFADTLHFCKPTAKNRSLVARRIRHGWSRRGENRPAVLIAAIHAAIRPTCTICTQYLSLSLNHLIGSLYIFTSPSVY